MDGESSCESDVSESWSLIDLNLSEQLADEPLDTNTSDPIMSEATPKEIIKSENDHKSEKKIPAENFELREFFNNSNQLDDLQAVLSSTVDSPKRKSSINPFQDFIFLDEDKKTPELDKENNDLHENVKFNFNNIDILEGEHKSRETDFDTDGISVISEAECDETRYYSNENDKNWEEELQTEYLNAFERTNQSVIKKRRKRVKVYSDSSDDNFDNFNSVLVVPERKYSDSSAKLIDSSDEIQVSVNTKPVYRHYRNNVANTVLSLAMGVIFAGVACIALGHFLGVNDAEQAAGEMMEALKRLQMENIQLQSRLSHLSRVFFTRETHQTKPDLSQTNVAMHKCINSDLDQQIYKTEDVKKDNNGKLNSGIENNFMSISKLENLIKKRDLVNNNVGMEIENIIHQIHDHMTFLSNVSKNDPKLKRFQELDSKIAGFIDKLAQNPPKTEVGFKNLLKRLNKFSGKLNQRLCKHFGNSNTQNFKLNCEIIKGNFQKKEQNLNLFQWFPVKEENQYPIMNLNSVTSNENPIIMYNFPQPEKYYESPHMNSIGQNDALNSDVKEDYNAVIEEELDSNPVGTELQKEKISSSVPALLQPEKVPLTVTPTEVEMELNRKIFNEHFRNNRTNDKVYKEKKKEKKRKEEKRKQFDRSSDYKKNRKENYKFDDVKRCKYSKDNSCKDKFNKKIWKEYLKTKKHDDRKDEKNILKREFEPRESKPSDEFKNKSCKNTQKSKYDKKGARKDFSKKSDNHMRYKNKKYKIKKSSLMFVKNPNAKLYAQIHLGKNKCGSNCYNISGDWVYKMAEGREQCRRYRRLSDWQFDRARSREALRDVDGNWFVERAAARENGRDGAKWYFKRYDARNHQRRGFSPETFSWI